MEKQTELETVLSALRNEIKGLRTELGVVKDIVEQRNIIPEFESSRNNIENRQEINKQNSIDEKIFLILLSFQIPSSNLGSLYLREAIKMVYEDITRMSRITKMIYPSIAEKYNSTVARVERGIRHSIESAWHYSNDKSFVDLKKYFPERPTNSEFITLVAEKLRLEHQKVSA